MFTQRVRIATTEDYIIEDRMITESQPPPEVTENGNVIPTTPTLITSPLLHLYPHKQEEGKNHEEEEVTGDCETVAETLLYRPSRMFKIVFIGNSGVGKTSFINRYSTVIIWNGLTAHKLMGCICWNELTIEAHK